MACLLINASTLQGELHHMRGFDGAPLEYIVEFIQLAHQEHVLLALKDC